jgi:hypothetical protein
MFCSFLSYLTTLSQLLRLHIVEFENDYELIGKDLDGSDHIVLMSQHLPEGAEENHRTLSQDNWTLCR